MLRLLIHMRSRRRFAMTVAPARVMRCVRWLRSQKTATARTLIAGCNTADHADVAPPDKLAISRTETEPAR